MSLRLDKSAWKRVTLGEVVRHVTDRVDAEASGLERFLAGEHIPSGSLTIDNWGVIGRDPIGPMFYKRFQPGHVLYVSRRTYLRKVAVPDFEGITGEKTFVLESIDCDALLQEFLPFVLSAEVFHNYAIRNSRGSVNPYLNWGELAAYEFDLPPFDDQKRISDLLWAIERESLSLAAVWGASAAARRAWIDGQLESLMAKAAIPFERTWARSPESGWSAAPVDEHTGRFVLSLAALGPNGYRQGHLKNVPDTVEVRDAVLAREDLLISRANTVDSVGRVGIFCEERGDVSFPDTMMRLRLLPTILPAFAEAVLSSSHGRRHMRRTAAGSATSMVKINRASLGRFIFPDVSMDIQQMMLEQLAVFNRALDACKEQASRLWITKNSISADIFEGPHEPV